MTDFGRGILCGALGFLVVGYVVAVALDWIARNIGRGPTPRG